MRLAKSAFRRTAVGRGFADARIRQNGKRNRIVDRKRTRLGFDSGISQCCRRCGADLRAGRDGRLMTSVHVAVVAPERRTNRPDGFG